MKFEFPQWVMIPYGLVSGYQHFGEVVGSSGMSVTACKFIPALIKSITFEVHLMVVAGLKHDSGQVTVHFLNKELQVCDVRRPPPLT
jgi:hypothetical protein